jgi:chromosome transmission fidelity protein 18
MEGNIVDCGVISATEPTESQQRSFFFSFSDSKTGKTTLAHIVARHAGYRPVEVNASDERSSGVLKDRIQRAMESTTINFKPGSSSPENDSNNTSPMKKNSVHRTNDKDDYGKPNCLILDEIDGADARGSIQALVDIVKAEIPSANNKKKQTTTTTATYLRRPIICICNHKYAPALRPLLPYAVHFNVEPPSSARLVARLKAILNEENMPMMGGGPLLHQLVVSSGGDIRSCLFTLQFAAAESKDSKDLAEALTHSLSGTGLKDNRNDIASTISAVFRKTKPGSAQFTTRLSSLSSKDRDRASVSRVMNAVDGLGDDSAAVNAMFLNVLRVSYIDPAFDRCSAAHELLSFAANAQYQQSRYAVPVVSAGIHLLCRVEVKPNLTFSSRELSDMRYRRDSNLGLVQKFCEGLPTKAKNLKCNSLLAEEFIPMVVWVLSAGNGAVSLSRAASSIDILTSKEQDAAKKHVEALCGLGLTYTVDREQQEKQRVGTFHRESEMRLEPAIDRLVDYSSLRLPYGLHRMDIPSKMKELLAHQVLLESFRQRDISASKSPAKKEKVGVIARKTPDAKSARNAESDLSSAHVTPRKLGEHTASMNLPSAKATKVCRYCF